MVAAPRAGAAFSPDATQARSPAPPRLAAPKAKAKAQAGGSFRSRVREHARSERDRKVFVMGQVIKDHTQIAREARVELIEPVGHPLQSSTTFKGIGTTDSSEQRVEQPITEHMGQWKTNMKAVKELYMYLGSSQKHSPKVGWWRFLVCRPL